MNAAVLDRQAHAQREAGNPAPALVPVRAPEQPRVAENPGTARSESMNELWRIHSMVLRRFALKLTLGNPYRADEIIQETLLRAWRHPEVVHGHERKVKAMAAHRPRDSPPTCPDPVSRHNNIIKPAPGRPNAVVASIRPWRPWRCGPRGAPDTRTPANRNRGLLPGRALAGATHLLNVPEGPPKPGPTILRQLEQLLAASSGEQAT